MQPEFAKCHLQIYYFVQQTFQKKNDRRYSVYNDMGPPGSEMMHLKGLILIHKTFEQCETETQQNPHN